MRVLALSPTCPSHPNKPWRRDTTSHFTKEMTQPALHTTAPSTLYSRLYPRRTKPQSIRGGSLLRCSLHWSEDRRNVYDLTLAESVYLKARRRPGRDAIGSEQLPCSGSRKPRSWGREKPGPCPQGLRPQTRNRCIRRANAETQQLIPTVLTGSRMLPGEPVFP